MQIGVISLGCAKNQVDSELMQGLLKSEGNVLVDDLSEADIIIVNTCGFIQAAKEESINTILEAAEYKQGRCKGLIVAGCLSQRYANDLLDEIKEIDGLVGTGNFTSIGRVIERVARGERVGEISEATYSYDDDIARVGAASHSVFVKVAEGCDNRCSYCAIPIVRGSFRSRRMESILREVARLADAGVKEINLIAQDTTRYGLDLFGEFRLVELLDKLLSLAGPQWFRLLYCYPAHFTDELIEKIATESRIANYIDIPLQHISPRILSLMHRRGTAAEVRQLISKLRT
ncbi:MAG: MiaB/RimO family radical SAM methylthiotransferase, partial [Bacillota bacterium]|nr:MiaB/RimO family radical SAM methylthiotransferase [Bacillota bacterium]